ncbi:MAG: hypothetical protein J5I93_18485 [Pirellulaceae bacterium]|nr:hypothetical protein [Pirellulaceae bacterium]
MRSSLVTLLLVLMLSLGHAGCQPRRLASEPAAARVGQPDLEAAGSRPLDSWRRTDQGWEDTRTWTTPARRPGVSIYRVHPLLVAALQLLGSLWALLAWATPRYPTCGRNSAFSDKSRTESASRAH